MLVMGDILCCHWVTYCVADGRHILLLIGDSLLLAFVVCLEQICQTTDSAWQAVEGAIMGMIYQYFSGTCSVLFS